MVARVVVEEEHRLYRLLILHCKVGVLGCLLSVVEGCKGCTWHDSHFSSVVLPLL